MKKGDYVVFLTLSNGHKNPYIKGGYESIPTDYVYKLAEDFKSTRFLIEMDLKGSCTNGYTTNTPSKMSVRPANSDEIQAYEKAGKPVPAIESNYEIF